MELLNVFEKEMEACVNMALATSVDGQPNVRVVTFAYDPNQKGKVFFTTFKGNKKIEEFAQNPKVACIFLPTKPEAETQARIFGTVQQSDIGIDRVIELVAEKFPGDADTLKMAGDGLSIYEVCFDEAYVTIGMTQAQRLSF